MMHWLKQLLFCKHEFEFIETIEEQNLRGGYDHLSQIYVCKICGKREVREEPFRQ